MTRRELRDSVFKILFRVEFYDEKELTEQLELFGEELDHIKDHEVDMVTERFQDVYSHLPEIDEAINGAAKGWKTSRMGKVDLAIIRLAVYEIRYEKLPKGIAINEAVELAKTYGTDQSAGFVNGVLARIHE